jgi:PBP1b-binding outer membrane lipoprotein LpoB
MKLYYTKSLLIILIILLLVSCSNINDSISKKKAEQLVLERHNSNIGFPRIISIEIKRNAYYIEWENIENKEWGIDKVTKDGEVKMIEATIE